MLPEDRHDYILDDLRHNQSVRIADLCQELGVTRETIRKDLHVLEEQNLLKKVHGGAVLDKPHIEPPYATRNETDLDEKRAIAKRAVDYIEDGDSIYIDVGTTTLLMASYLQTKQNLTVLTNSLKVAYELSENTNFNIIMSGGMLRNQELALSGSLAYKIFQEFYIDKAFIGGGGVSLVNGITDYHIEETQLKTMMGQKARQSYVLADYSKFGKTAFKHVCNLEEVEQIITDKRAIKTPFAELDNVDIVE